MGIPRIPLTAISVYAGTGMKMLYSSQHRDSSHMRAPGLVLTIVIYNSAVYAQMDKKVS
jgi:hypothetical protein